jgi:hypothetical protein
MNTLTLRLSAALAPILLVSAAIHQDGAAPSQDVVWDQAELEQLAKRIEAEIEELRGERFREPVAVKVASRDELIDYMKRRTEESDPPEKIAADERIAKLLAMIPPDMDLMATAYALLEEQVAGFYDPPSKTFYLMETMPKGFAGPILAHELVHALDDQLYDLDTKMEELSDHSDRLQAYRFVVEGSGTSGGNLWTMQHMDQVDLSGYQDMMDAQNASLAAAPAWLWKPLLGAYLQGAAFLTRSDSILAGQTQQASSEDIARAFREVPQSTEQVLHPEKYWDPAQRDEPQQVRLQVGQLPEGWEQLRTDTLGELGLALVTSPPETRTGADFSNPMAILAMAYTNTAAEGWDGDSLVLLGKDDASWLRLVTVWDSERDAGEFFGVMQGLMPTLEGACEALGEQSEQRRTRSGAELAYGERREVVVLTLWAGVARRELGQLTDAVGHTIE